MENNRDYYRRRAAQEFSAADNAASEAVAGVHRSLAERYLALAGEPQQVPGRVAQDDYSVVSVAVSGWAGPTRSPMWR
jgi:hypothetical protein